MAVLLQCVPHTTNYLVDTISEVAIGLLIYLPLAAICMFVFLRRQKKTIRQWKGDSCNEGMEE